MLPKPNKTFRVYSGLTSLCCLTHLMTHLGPANWHHVSWWLACSIIAVACWNLQRLSLQRFFALIGLQMCHTLVDAPFNADHWLLLFFVNGTIVFSAIDIRLKGQPLSEEALFKRFAPAARLTFLICYGYAALSKLNTHFLMADSSCARELAEIQIAASPWLKNISVPMLAGWVAAICECSVPLLLIPPRTRRIGILTGVLFHTILVLSPGIAVFDFTMMVYTMVFLFAGDDIGTQLHALRTRFHAQAPAVESAAAAAKPWLLLAIASFMIGRSAMGMALFGSPRIGRLNWLVNMLLAATVIALTWKTLFAKPADGTRLRIPSATLKPQLRWHFLILGLAILNGACPYLGLKTQGSFTMFSNLRTEAGYWNHLLIPRRVRIFDHYQDDLVRVARIDDERLQADFVDQDCMIPRFEVQRAASKNPDMGITVVRDGKQLQLKPISLDPELGQPVNWLSQKLMIFRPVTADGSPYCGN